MMIFSQGVLHKEECVAEVHVILKVFSSLNGLSTIHCLEKERSTIHRYFIYRGRGVYKLDLLDFRQV